MKSFNPAVSCLAHSPTFPQIPTEPSLCSDAEFIRLEPAQVQEQLESNGLKGLLLCVEPGVGMKFKVWDSNSPQAVPGDCSLRHPIPALSCS